MSLQTLFFEKRVGPFRLRAWATTRSRPGRACAGPRGVGVGLVAARSRLRKQVVPGRRRPSVEERSRRSSDLLTRRPSEANHPRWTPWRELLKRSFGVDGFACPMCGQRMMLRAVVMPPATFKVLRGLEAASRAPPRLASLKI